MDQIRKNTPGVDHIDTGSSMPLPAGILQVSDDVDDVNHYDAYYTDDDDDLLVDDDLNYATVNDGMIQLGYREEDDQLLQLEHQLEKEQEYANRSCTTKLLDGFSVFLVRVPHRYFPGSILVILALFTLCGVAGYYSYHYHPPQDFINELLDNPLVGFETRGTYIKKGQFTAEELHDQVMSRSKYSLRPNYTLAFKNLKINPLTLIGLERMLGEAGPNNKDPHDDYDPSNYTSPLWKPSDNISQPPVYLGINGATDYFVYAFESTDNDVDLYNYQSMIAMCKMQKNIIIPFYKGLILPSTTNKQREVYSLPSIIATFYQKDCMDLTQKDLTQFKAFYAECLESDILSVKGQMPVSSGLTGGGGHLNMASTTAIPQNVPKKCVPWKEMISNVKEYIVDKGFTNSSLKGPLKYTTLFVKHYFIDPLEFYHKHIEGQEIKVDNVRVCGVNFQDDMVKWNLFQKYLISDTLWFALAIGLVFLVMFIYQLRVDLMICTVISVLFGFVLAYAVYYFFLHMKFFPFINLLALLVLIAVGADDVFVFFDIFKQMQTANPDLPLEKVISKTFGHAALSVFVTSLTTSAAFFANSVSNITAIKVFGIFAGTAIIVNFFVMVLLIPSVIVLCELATNPIKRFLEKHCKPVYIVACCGCGPTKASTFFKNIFGKYFPTLIDKTWFVWLIVLSIIGIVSGIVVFVKPRFKLPVSNDFQLFETSNLIENWDLNIKNSFYFSKDESSARVVIAYYIWGFEDRDAGNHWDPHDKQSPLVEDPSFNYYNPETCKWLNSMCEDVQKADYMPDFYREGTICNLDGYNKVAKSVCNSYPEIKTFLPQCCMDGDDVTVNQTNFELCLPIYQYLLSYNGHIYIKTNVSEDTFGYVIYEVSTNKVKGYLLYMRTELQVTVTYDTMQGYYNILAGKFLDKLKKAPKSVQNGFVAFSKGFILYDLQHSLATGTYYSIGLSLAVAFVVMLLTSLNVLVTVYAMLSITLAILCTVASIVLLGWHLNVIESVIISLSVGLSIDFTIHFGVAYRLSESKEPTLRVHDSFRQVGAAVTMAALTTFLAGAGIMPCRVLPYIKLGIFLMLVMTFAWTYANFFFQSLCKFIGPRGNFCQLSAICDSTRKWTNPCRVRSKDHGMTLRRIDSDDSLLLTF